MSSEGGSCATVIYAFIYQCRDVSVPRTAPGDVIIIIARVSANLILWKGRKQRRPLRPLQIDYALNRKWAPGTGPHRLLKRWIDIRPTSAGLFNFNAGQPLGATSLGAAVMQALTLIRPVPLAGFYDALHSSRIGGLNELDN